MPIGHRRPAPPYLAMAAAVVLAASAAACAATTTYDAACPNHGPDFTKPTNGKMLAYALNPKTIQYHFIDVRQDTIEYTWDTSQAYYGGACLRFQTTDSVHINNSGAFQFVMSGSNGAYMRRHLVGGGVTTNDSVLGYTFSGCEGTGGTYLVGADSSISLSWTDGTQSILFSNYALHKLLGDSISTSVSVSTHADSLRGSWKLHWGRAYCGEGY